MFLVGIRVLPQTVNWGSLLEKGNGGSERPAMGGTWIGAGGPVARGSELGVGSELGAR